MNKRPDQQQQWSVHAEFTISHPGAGNPENPPEVDAVQNERGVRMLYSWTSNENNNSAPSDTISNRSTISDAGRPFGFQRGNLFFTSTPPRKYLGVQDSGYGSDLLSPSSLASSTLPRRTILPYNRKCRSTCSIVLSGNNQNVREEHAGSGRSHCGRTQSLRCQTPSLCCDGKNTNFYGCGDPWCHHVHYGDDFSCLGRISPVLEEEPAHATIYASSKKDASVQTFEMIDKCTSPFLKTDSFNKSPTSNTTKMKRSQTHGSSRVQPAAPQSPSSFTPDSLESPQPAGRKLRRSPVGRNLPVFEPNEKKSSASDPVSSDPSKKSRTIHIDVYCTGTDMESDASSSDSSRNDTASTPQTVFESSKLRVTRKKAEEEKLPFRFKENKSTSKDDSDVDDGASTAYPSKLSSYSTINDFSSSLSSVPKSWTPYSMSSCTVPDDYDSIANTSWKDTFSDIDSLMQSSASIAQAESLDFVPKHLTIDESPELGNQDNISLQPSDSFEYANSEDKLRIKRMEEMLKNKSQGKHWKSPQLDRKMLIRQKKMQEYINRRLSQASKSKDSDSDASDDSETGWTFIKGDDKKLERNNTVKIPSTEKPVQAQIAPEPLLEREESSPPPENNKPESLRIPQPGPPIGPVRQGLNLLPCKSSSSVDILQQRLKYDSCFGSPFTILPGQYTEQRSIARRFGPIVNVFRKPGHHIGPVKNPDCLCDHCQRHFKNLGFRNRTRSVSETPQSWKTPPEEENVASKQPRYSDF